MKIVTNLNSQSISIQHIIIPPKSNYIWYNNELTFELNRKLYRLQSMGLIQVNEKEDEVVTTPPSIEEDKSKEIINENLTEDEVEELKAKGAKNQKTRKRNTRKKGE